MNFDVVKAILNVGTITETNGMVNVPIKGLAKINQVLVNAGVKSKSDVSGNVTFTEPKKQSNFGSNLWDDENSVMAQMNGGLPNDEPFEEFPD